MLYVRYAYDPIEENWGSGSFLLTVNSSVYFNGLQAVVWKKVVIFAL